VIAFVAPVLIVGGILGMSGAGLGLAAGIGALGIGAAALSVFAPNEIPH